MSTEIATMPIPAGTQWVKQTIATPTVMENQAIGVARQLVAQAAATAVVDATDHLRAMSTVGTAAISTLTSQMVADPDNASEYDQMIKDVQSYLEHTAKQFEKVGTAAGRMLAGFGVAG